MAGWIGVDLDGTLAHFDSWRGPDSIGLPIPSMVKRVEAWIAEGREVRIFTARATDSRLIPPIKRWLKLHGLPDLRITNVKDFQMIELWDDRAVQVIHNTGRAVQPNTLDEDHKPELIDVSAESADETDAVAGAEHEVTPTDAEVEAFKQAVKARARSVDENLLDALDAGEDYIPSAPTTGESAKPKAKLAAATTAASEWHDTSDTLFPAVSDALIPGTPAPLPAAAIDQSPMLPRYDRLPSDVPLVDDYPAANLDLPKKQAAFPSLSVDEDEFDSGFPSLRIERR